MNRSRPHVVAVIPARMASSRFPGKPVASISGLPMIEHVRRRAELAALVDEVVVATCDREILEVVESFGGRAVMTDATHERCTDRVEEAMRRIEADVVAVVQGDEPLLLPSTVDAVVEPLLAERDVGCTNLVSRLGNDTEDRGNPDIVKACCDQSGRIIYLTRAPVPHRRTQSPAPVFRQTGIMAFRKPVLHRFSELPETPFERAESVDMMRLLEHGISIRAVVTDNPTVGVDRPGDVELVERILREDALQRGIFDQIVGAARTRSTVGGA